jgi:CO/xanthine dehydrogenase Mo-binding subunit
VNRRTHHERTQGFIGKSVERREDARFLTGKGQYTDDITLPGQTYAFFLRSPYAHAASRASTPPPPPPGVLGIFTGEHFKAVGGLPCGWLINSIDGTPMKEPRTRSWPTARCATWATAWRWWWPRRSTRPRPPRR